MKLKQENYNLSEKINMKDKNFYTLQIEKKMNDDSYNNKLLDLQIKYEEKNLHFKELEEKKDKIEKDFKEMLLKNSSDLITKSLENPINRKEILEKKFSTSKYDDKYIIKSLQKDILDFQDYIKDQNKKNRIIVDELIRLVQTSVNDCIPEYEVKLYGSHATNLCLPWSDLDIVLVNKRVPFSTNYTVLQNLYLVLLDKPWKKSIKLIDSALIPIIKITANDEFNCMQMDISIQDGKHFGLKSVELVKSFMNEFEALEPLIFSMKNLLKNANLNDPYTVLN